MTTPALFLDRDGTLVHARHYPSRPEELVLYDGLAPDLRRLQAGGFRLVLITNQSGLARGLFGEPALAAMHHHLARELETLGVRLGGVYFCPHHPEGVVPHLAIPCACRKPAPGLLRQAAADLGLDLPRSWFLGDILDDVEAGRRAGCRTVLVDLATESPAANPLRRPHFVARDTRHALAIVATVEGLGGDADLGYCPPSWPRAADRAVRRTITGGSPPLEVLPSPAHGTGARGRG